MLVFLILFYCLIDNSTGASNGSRSASSCSEPDGKGGSTVTNKWTQERQPDGKVINNWSSEHSQENQLLTQRNWKQCTFNSVNLDQSSGKILGCTFKKTSSSSSLRVTYQGSLRMLTTTGPDYCNRWYLTFDDKECGSPASIDGVVSVSVSALDVQRVATIDGFCDNIPQGTVSVDLYVGDCGEGKKLGEAITCWNSVCRIIIEEVEKSQ